MNNCSVCFAGSRKSSIWWLPVHNHPSRPDGVNSGGNFREVDRGDQRLLENKPLSALKQRHTACCASLSIFCPLPAGSVSTIGGGGDTTIPPPGRSPKQSLPGIGLRHPHMVGKLAPNSTHFTRELVKYVPGRGFFRAVPSQNGEKFVTSPPPSIVERVGSQFFRFRLLVLYLTSGRWA